MKIQEIMSTTVFPCRADESVNHAAQIMSRRTRRRRSQLPDRGADARCHFAGRVRERPVCDAARERDRDATASRGPGIVTGPCRSGI